MFRFPSPSLVVSMLALIVALGGAGYSATGGSFILGQVNVATNETRLSAPFNGRTLRLINASTEGQATALSLLVGAGRAPFTVNSAVKVNNLNADLLDGIEAAAFVQGGGTVDAQAVAIAPNSTVFVGPAVGGLIRLRYQCPFALGGNGAFRIINASTGVANFFVDSGGVNPDYFQLGSGGFIDYPANAAGDSFSIQAQGAPGVATVEAATVHRSASNDCHAQALLIVVG